MSVVVVVVRCPEPGLSLSPARATTTTSCGKQKEVVRGDGDLVTSVHYRDMSPPRPVTCHTLSQCVPCHEACHQSHRHAHGPAPQPTHDGYQPPLVLSGSDQVTYPR